MELRVHIQRPILTGLVILTVVLWWNGVIRIGWPGNSEHNHADAEGGEQASVVITDSIRDIDRERVRQAVLGNREEILRYELQILEDQALQDQTPEKVQELTEKRIVLLSIIKERSQSEKLLGASLQQLWDAQGTAFTLTRPDGGVDLDWPVRPTLGISAYFADGGYKKRFGFDHHAIDIPTEQGTPIRAPADGTVHAVSMNGLGYSYVTLQHADGMQTVYGHVSAANVKTGDSVTFGQVIGRSGGQPGSQGAGLLTTGPHLHFAVRLDGVLVDPLKYLPDISD
ncbi:MAG: M23 family metallopeptidase [Candidatus Peribacteraceae bacterium]|nr:M23 family metallopeptidase [Candidatus Peribacteraceae bacterium]